MNLTELLAATLFASLIGSIHCVGMCGPFAIFAGGNDHSVSGSKRFARLSAYHLGRLTTYEMMCVCIGVLAWPIRSGIAGVELQRMAGWLAGAVLIGIGISRLVTSILRTESSISSSLWLEQWTRTLVQSRRRFRNVSPVVSSYLWGTMSTLLPCGWLYIFLLASLSAPSMGTSLLMMFMFWVGTLPLLSITALSWKFVPSRWQSKLQPMIAVSIVAFGLFTLCNRSQADVASLGEVPRSQSSLELIRATVNAKLPCCVQGELRRIVPESRGQD